MSLRPGFFARLRTSLSVPNIRAGLQSFAQTAETIGEAARGVAGAVSGAARGSSAALGAAEAGLKDTVAQTRAAYAGASVGQFVQRNGLVIVLGLVLIFMVARK